MSNSKARTRVLRLLSGQFRPDDLIQTFLFARDHCDGRETISEIGAFVAHQGQRDRGIVTRSTREWFATVQFLSHAFKDRQRPVVLDPLRMPPYTREYFLVAIGRIPTKTLAAKARMSRAVAFRLMKSIAARLTENPDGTWSLPKDLTPKEIDLVQCASSTFVVRDAFEADRLVTEFFDTLRSNDLLTKEELRDVAPNFYPA